MRRRRSAREIELLRAAKERLDRLQFYPEPVRMRHVRLVSAPWFFRIPGVRRFAGYELGPLILVEKPLDEVPESLVAHELCHVWQHQHRPVYMWLSYLWQGYRFNEHEIEARAAAGQVR